jgi:hypothetical protein
MAATMNSNMQQSIAHTNPPVLGGTEARALVDELMGVPYAVASGF